MDELGIEDNDTSGALSESLALKAFLRLKREERRRHSNTSSITVSERIMSTPSYEKSREYNISYDPSSYLEISNISEPPETPVIGFSLNRDEFEEEHKYTSLHADNRGGNAGPVNSSFSSMHAIINTSFQEKIDYQRKLREQQTELTALRDKMQLLRTENTRLTVAAVKAKQKHLPVILRNLIRKRRLNKLRRAMRQWFELCYDKNVAIVRKTEEYWGREHHHWQERERLLAKLLKRSVALNMMFVLRRTSTTKIRRAFNLWMKFSSEHGPHLNSMAQFLNTSVNRSICRQVLHVWHLKFKFKMILLRMMKKFNAVSDRQKKKIAIQAWKRAASQDKTRSKLYFFLLRMIRNTNAYRMFQKWKEFAFVLHPLKVRILKALVSRGVSLQIEQKRHAFTEWRIIAHRIGNNQKVLGKVIVRMRSKKKFAAFHKWKTEIKHEKNVGLVFMRMTSYYARRMEFGKRSAFMRWHMITKELQRAEHRAQLSGSYEEMERNNAKFRQTYSALQRRHEEYRSLVITNTRLVFRAMRSLSVNKDRLSQLMVALHRWKWMIMTEYNVQMANRQRHMEHIRSVINKTFLSKQSFAFEKWKSHVASYHRSRGVVLRLLRNSSRKNTRMAFQLWVSFTKSHETYTVQAKLAMYRVRTVLESWRHASLLHAWRTWKQYDSSQMKMVNSIFGYFKVFRRMKLRHALCTWRQSTIFHELRSTKRQLLRSTTANEARLKVVFSGMLKRGVQKYFVLWQEHVRETIAVKKTILLVLQRNVQTRKQRGFQMWKDNVNKIKFMSGGCRAVRRVIIQRISNALLRAFRLWTLHVKDCRLNDAEMLHNHLEITQDELNRTRNEVLFSQQTVQQMQALIKHLEVKSQSQDAKLYHIMCMHCDKHIMRHFFRVLNEHRLTSRHNKALCRHVLNRYISKSRATALVVAFNRWSHYNRDSKYAFRMVKSVLMKWTHRTLFTGFNKWKNAVMECRSDDMRVALDNASSKQMLYLMTSHTFEYYFEKWKGYIRSIYAQRQRLKATLSRMLHRSVNMAMRKWKAVSKGQKTMSKLRRNLMLCFRYKVASAWRKWCFVCVHSQRKLKLLKSVCLACIRSKTASLTIAFRQWRTISKAQELYAKMSSKQATWLRTILMNRDLQRVFSEWRRVTYRDVRRVGCPSLASVIGAMPTAGLLYNMFNNKRHTLDDIVLEANRAIRQFLPDFLPEVYVMQSANMLRAVGLPNQTYDSRQNMSPINMTEKETFTTTEEFLGSSYGRFTPFRTDELGMNQSLHSPLGRFNQPEVGDFMTGVISVIVGRGPVGMCAKSGEYGVFRENPSTYSQMEGADNGPVVLVVIPLVSNRQVVGVLQLSSADVRHMNTGLFDSGLVMGGQSPLKSPSRGNIHMPNASPFHVQIYKMCLEVGIDLSTALKLSVVVSALSHSILLYHNSIESRLAEDHREVSKENEMNEILAEKDKALSRIEHLERSRLRHFKQSRKLREEAILWRKRCIEVKQSLEEYMQQVEAYDHHSREVEALHRAMREATAQVFGTDESQWTNPYTSSEYIDTDTMTGDTLLMKSTMRSGFTASSYLPAEDSQQQGRASRSSNAGNVMFTPSVREESVRSSSRERRR